MTWPGEWPEKVRMCYEWSISIREISREADPSKVIRSGSYNFVISKCRPEKDLQKNITLKPTETR